MAYREHDHRNSEHRTGSIGNVYEYALRGDKRGLRLPGMDSMTIDEMVKSSVGWEDRISQYVSTDGEYSTWAYDGAEVPEPDFRTQEEREAEAKRDYDSRPHVVAYLGMKLRGDFYQFVFQVEKSNGDLDEITYAELETAASQRDPALSRMYKALRDEARAKADWPASQEVKDEVNRRLQPYHPRSRSEDEDENQE